MTHRDAAQNILKQINSAVGFYSDEKPTAIHHTDHSEIVWESGPFEWSTNDNYGLFEELKNLGMDGDYEYQPYWHCPKGFYVEAINSYSIAIYRD